MKKMYQNPTLLFFETENDVIMSSITGTLVDDNDIVSKDFINV